MSLLFFSTTLALVVLVFAVLGFLASSAQARLLETNKAEASKPAIVLWAAVVFCEMRVIFSLQKDGIVIISSNKKRGRSPVFIQRQLLELSA
jgi:hypothetical protein